MTSHHHQPPQASDDREMGRGDSSHAVRGYQPPRIVVLGTIAQLTHGSNPTTTDGVTPGSTF